MTLRKWMTKYLVKHTSETAAPKIIQQFVAEPGNEELARGLDETWGIKMKCEMFLVGWFIKRLLKQSATSRGWAWRN